MDSAQSLLFFNICFLRLLPGDHWPCLGAMKANSLGSNIYNRQKLQNIKYRLQASRQQTFCFLAHLGLKK